MRNRIDSTNDSPGLIEKLDFFKIIKRTLLITLPVLVVVYIVVFVAHSFYTRIEIDVIKKIEKNVVNNKLGLIQSEIKHVTNDLRILASNSRIERLWDENSSDIIESINSDFLNLARYQQSYDQVRLLNEKGDEVIRVNYNRGNPQIVSKENLQNKKNRYYFENTFELNRNEVFVSPLDLNIEFGKIEQPLKPMIRFGTPVFDKMGVKKGIVLLNYFGQQVIDQLFDNNFSKIEEQLLLVNSEGYLLKGANQKHEWGFMYDDKKDFTFMNMYPGVWEKIINKELSQFEAKDGLYTGITFYPIIESQKNAAIIKDNLALDEELELSKKYSWNIVSIVSSESLYAARNKRLKVLIVVLFIFSVSLFIILWKLTKARFLKNLAQEELKKNEEHLKMLNATKDKFFSIVAHDLKNPISSMLGLSQLLIDNFEKYNVDKQKIFINNIYLSVEKTFKLLENLLLWSKSQKGRISFSPQKENLYLTSVEALEHLNQLVKDKSIVLKNEIPENLFARIDTNILSTILRNLVTNAIKFTPQKGEINVNARTIENDNKQAYIEISIKDSGVGIPLEIQSELFEITENVSTPGTEKEKGSGLGLILCKEFVKIHGGEIWVKSEVGRGSEFIFTIPYEN